MDFAIEILSNLMYGYFEGISSTDFTIGSSDLSNQKFKARVIFRIFTPSDIDQKITDIYNTYNSEDHKYLTITHQYDVEETFSNKFVQYQHINRSTVTIILTDQADLEAIAGLLRINGKWEFSKLLSSQSS